jgi:tetratricopeptide (TPR) repeat protein
MKILTCVSALLLGSCLCAGQAAPPAPAAQPDASLFAAVRASLDAGKKDEALAKAMDIVKAWPNNADANAITGFVLLQMAKPGDAMPYIRKAQSIDPGDPRIHLLLVQVYAEQGDTEHRDQEIALLRGYHSDGRHPEFARLTGFMIEEIPAGSKKVQAEEYFQPVGRYHFYYRFNVYDATGKLEEFFALASEDEDQAFFEEAHPKRAKAGERRFSIDEYTGNSQALLGFVDGEPSYDVLRARILKALSAE